MPDSRASWWMRFTVLPVATPGRTIVEARFRDVVLETPGDAEEWARRVNVELAKYGEIIDLLIDLEGLRVRPAASRRFGEVRAKVLATYARHSARYGPDGWTATSVNTSRVLFGAEANIHATRELALAALLELRASDP